MVQMLMLKQRLRLSAEAAMHLLLRSTQVQMDDPVAEAVSRDAFGLHAPPIADRSGLNNEIQGKRTRLGPRQRLM